MMNYEKACIYKICCKDVSVKDEYIGSTTNEVQRRYLHKKRCSDPKDKGHNFRVYQFIREHGGWDNWELVVIADNLGCTTSRALLFKEREYIEARGATLNSKSPVSTDDDKKMYTIMYNDLNREKINEHMKALYRERKASKI